MANKQHHTQVRFYLKRKKFFWFFIKLINFVRYRQKQGNIADLEAISAFSVKTKNDTAKIEQYEDFQVSGRKKGKEELD